MIVAAALAMLVAVVPTPAAETLVVTMVDASAYPKVVVDFVLPKRFAAVEVTPAMVAIDGAPAATVAPVDPTGVIVSVIVDDRPSVPADVVGASQGGAIELVRALDARTRIAIGTSSGMQTAFTADPGATIARIAGITAGAPAVTPLPQLMLDAAAALGSSDAPDRHLVVVLSGPLGASEEQLSQLEILLASNGITLHLVSAAGLVEPALISIAEQSGGTVPIAGETLASFDAITAGISDRYRVTTTIGSPGEHIFALTVNGETIETVVTVSPPTLAAPTTTIPELASSPAVPSSPAVVDEEVPGDVEANTTPTAVEAGAGTDATVSPDDNTSPLTVVAIALMAVLIAVASGDIALRRRRAVHVDGAGTDEAELAAPEVAEPIETTGAHSYPVIESESMREAIRDGVRDPESPPVTELEVSPEPEPPAEYVSHKHKHKHKHKLAPESKLVPAPEPDPEPEPEREPEPELASATDPRPVVGAGPRPARKAPVSSGSVVGARRTERPTPAQLTRAGGRSKRKPARVAADPGAGPDWLVSGFLRFCPASGEVWSGRSQVHLDPQEVALLQLLMTSGSRGVTRNDIIKTANLDPAGRDFAPMLARIKGKTGWRGSMVRRESVTVYVFDSDID